MQAHAELPAWHATGLAWQTLMHGVARLMKALATRCNVAVVCTTHTVGGAQVPAPPFSCSACATGNSRLVAVAAPGAGRGVRLRQYLAQLQQPDVGVTPWRACTVTVTVRALLQHSSPRCVSEHHV